MKARKLVSVCLLLLITTIAYAQTSSQSEELAKLETQWNTARLKSDADTLAQLCADDLVVTVPRTQFTGGKAVDALKSGRVKFEGYETVDSQIRVHENTAMITGRLQRTRTMNERTMDDDWRFTNVYFRIDGKWKAVAFYGSEIPAEPSPKPPGNAT